MHEVKAKVEKLCGIKEKICGAVEAETMKGVECWNTEELGDAVDMIKDLCEAEEKLWKACYYKTVLEQMKKAEEEGMTEMPDMPMSWMLPNDRAGYDSWRYSSGRYAPTGKGHYVGRHGFTPTFPNPYYPTWPNEGDMGQMNDRMGYTSEHMGSDMNRAMTEERRYGRSMDKFANARRHYTETHSESDKREMKEHGKAHVMETVATMKEIWSEADPELKSTMKDQLTALISAMK